MRRRFIALVLLLVPFSAGTALSGTLAEAAHFCGCDARMCRCPHHHTDTHAPKCHGSAGATLTSCSSEQELLLATIPLVLPPPLAEESQCTAELVAEPTVFLQAHIEDIHSPPPRRPLA